MEEIYEEDFATRDDQRGFSDGVGRRVACQCRRRPNSKPAGGFCREASAKAAAILPDQIERYLRKADTFAPREQLYRCRKSTKQCRTAFVITCKRKRSPALYVRRSKTR